MDNQTKRGPGRPRKEPIPYDPEVVSDFVKRYFEVEREIKVLQEDKKTIREEFKDKINQKLVAKIIRLVKIKVALEEENASPETVTEIEDLILDKINMVV